MIKITLGKENLLSASSQSLVMFLQQDFEFDAQLQAIAHAHFPQLQGYFKQMDFTGKAQSVVIVPVSGDNQEPRTLVFVGLGSALSDRAMHLEMYRRALGSMIRRVESFKPKSISLMIPFVHYPDVSSYDLVKETTIALHLAAYKFIEYFSENNTPWDCDISFVESIKDLEEAQSALKEGSIIAQAVNEARHWVDTPPCDLTPPHLSDYAEKIAKEYGLKVTVFNEADVNNMGMGGLAAVSRGSDRDCHFVILEYSSGKKDAQTLGLVGKGITFDSGGLSLKPAQSMETMKDDMAGAAAVVATMKVVAQLKPDVNVIAFAPLSENLPSGKATKPGDVVRFYNGKTAEIKNTDAEGRLILADALSYAVKHYKLDAIIDIATLTGACAYALGPFFSGLMTQHQDLSQKIQDAAARSGDRVWPLPFHDDYKVAIKSSIADICNIGNPTYKAGAITAGFFLQNFVGNVPWAHLDVAGTAFEVPDLPYYRSTGATGVGVRLFVDLIKHW